MFLVYIPTILAYTFISLLVVILGFIVIYVSHKIYVTIYDNLPVAQLSSASSSASKISQGIKKMAKSSSLVTGPIARKSKTALRIIVTLEPCYLAYAVYKLRNATAAAASHTSVGAMTSGHSCFGFTQEVGPIQDLCSSNNYQGKFVVQYYDNLSAIPTRRRLHLHCSNACDMEAY
uniref:Uncharacterized protein n=1 Tax=Musca domestica TaxID=7370 RepID=A0A1I8NHC6_MUSDO